LNHKIKRIQSHYSRRVTRDRKGFDILDWSSAEAQRIRFDILLQAASQRLGNPTGISLLDVGCGLADLAVYLDERNVPMRYVGVDITWAILEEARRRHPARTLLQADVFLHSPFPARSFDVAFCSGIFNLRLGNNQEFAANAVRRLGGLVSGLVVANFLHVRSRHQYPHCFYFDPDMICRAVDDVARDVEVIDDYLENDFTVVMRPRTPSVIPAGYRGSSAPTAEDS